METISREKAIQILIKKNISFLDINQALKIFPFQNENSLFKFLQRLEKTKILKRIVKIKYVVLKSYFSVDNHTINIFKKR